MPTFGIRHALRANLFMCLCEGSTTTAVLGAMLPDLDCSCCGFQDVSASWQFTVDALQKEWFVIAPDWRGFGLTPFGDADSFWAADLVADLDALLDHFEPDRPALVVAHSMGATAASTYVSAIPGRVEKFVNVEGMGGAPAHIDELAGRYRVAYPACSRHPTASLHGHARVCTSHDGGEPHLTPERAEFFGPALGRTGGRRHSLASCSPCAHAN